jgi:TonB family protein
MRIPNRLPQKMICFLVLFIACGIPTQALPQTDQAKDKTPAQEKKPEEKKPETTARGGGMEILSDTMGVDFEPYMKRLRSQVQRNWEALIPPVALPPVNKSGTVAIELAIMKDGKVRGMKLVKSSGDAELDKAAWGGITDAIPLPTLPPEFKGDYLRLRCNFIYNPAAKAAQEANQAPKK